MRRWQLPSASVAAVAAAAVDATSATSTASAAGAASAAAYYEAAFGQVPATLDELRHCVDAHRCSTFYAASSPETHSSLSLIHI